MAHHTNDAAMITLKNLICCLYTLRMALPNAAHSRVLTIIAAMAMRVPIMIALKEVSYGTTYMENRLRANTQLFILRHCSSMPLL